MNSRCFLLILALRLTGCAEAIWRVDSATPPRRWASDPRIKGWRRPLDITYTFYISGRVTADVTPGHQWWRHIHGTGWEIDATEDPDGVDTIVFDGIIERYWRHYPGGEAILTVIPPRGRKPHSNE